MNRLQAFFVATALGSIGALLIHGAAWGLTGHPSLKREAYRTFFIVAVVSLVGVAVTALLS